MSETETPKIFPGCTVIVVSPDAKIKMNPDPRIIVVRDQFCPEGHVIIATYDEVMDAYAKTTISMGYGVPMGD
jgi:hypothetical protein